MLVIRAAHQQKAPLFLILPAPVAKVYIPLRALEPGLPAMPTSAYVSFLAQAKVPSLGLSVTAVIAFNPDRPLAFEVFAYSSRHLVTSSLDSDHCASFLDERRP